jgi:PAS domain S-box-containing protein
MAAVARSHETGGHFTCQYRLRRRDGGYVWVRDDAAIVRDAEGRPQMLQGVMMDVTAARRSAQDLRESEERFRYLVDTAFDGISICEYDRAANKRRLVLCNDRYVEMSGYSRRDLEEADDLNQLVVSHATPEERRRHEESIPVGIPIFGVSSWLRPDGRENYYEYTSVFVRKEGEIFLCYGVDRDVTERRAAEAELLTHREGLRRLNSQLSRVEEAERRRIAEGLHDHVGQLLVSAKMRLEALLSRQHTAADHEGLATIARLVDEAAEATQDLTFELSPPILHQLGLVPALEWLSDHIAKTWGLAVDVSASDGKVQLPEETAVLLFRSVSELLNNVAKHAGTHRATVEVTASDGDPVIVVSDEGSGFDPSTAEDSGRHAAGFGLFSVRERLHAVGGDIEIQSGPGRGTRVTLRVPGENARL